MNARMALAGAIAAVLGGIAYLLSQRREGSVEWHERNHWSLRKAAADRGEADIAKMRCHEAELLRAGRLVERIVLVSNVSPAKAAIDTRLALGVTSEMDLVYVDADLTTTIRLITRTNNAAARLARWERL